MSASYFQNNGKWYGKLLFSIILCIVLTLIVSSLISFLTYVGYDLNKTYESDVRNLTQTSKEVISMTESAQSLSFQIYRTFTVSKLMFYDDPSIFDITGAMNELENYLNSMPFIDSIYVYNSKNGLFYTVSRHGYGGTYSREELPDKGVIDILEGFHHYRPFTPIPRTSTSVNLAGDQETTVYSYLGYDAIGRTQKINSAVVINISSTWINKDIGVQNSNGAGKSYILDNENRLLPGDTLAPKNLSEADSALLADQVRGKETGYVVADFEGSKSLISFTSPDALDWQYVRITPYQSVTEALHTIRDKTILIAAGILAVGLLVSWVLSRMLYRPIHQLVYRMQALESEKRNSSYTIRQEKLRGLLHGACSLHTTSSQKLSQYGITFDFQASYRVTLLRIDEFTSLKQTRADDLTVYKFGIMNIGWEIGLAHYRVEAVDMNDDTVVLLLGRLDHSGQPDDELLRSVLKEIQQAITNYLKIGVSIAYSPEANQPQQLAAMYGLAKEASMHRLFYGKGCLINAEQIMSMKSKEYVFPVDRERRLTEALMTAKPEEAKKLFAEIVEETARYPFHVAQLAVSHLTMTVNNVLFTIQKYNGLDIGASASFSIPALNTFETVSELTRVFFELFDDIQEKLSSKRSTKQGDMIRRVNEIIQREYANPSLSLNYIADELGMSPIYLSRVYKQQTMNAIVDVINQIRLEQAKEQLEQTDNSIIDIALKTGYTSSSYFHRLFKRSFGVTPSDYRKLKAQ